MPVSIPLSQCSHHRTACARHSTGGPGTASCGQVWFHGPISARTGAWQFWVIRKTESRYPSHQPVIRKAGIVSLE